MQNYSFTNNAESELASPASAANTTIIVQAGKGALFASPGGFFMRATLKENDNIEIITVVSVAGDVLTVQRGQESTTAQNFGIGATIFGAVTAAFLADIVTSIIDVTYTANSNEQDIADNFTDIATLQTNIQGILPVLTGALPPNTTPVSAHQWYMVSGAGELYRATATNNPADWDLIYSSRRFARVDSASLYTGASAPFGRTMFDSFAYIAHLKVSQGATSPEVYIRLANGYNGNHTPFDHGVLQGGQDVLIRMGWRYPVHAVETAAVKDFLVFTVQMGTLPEAIGINSSRVIVKNTGVLCGIKYKNSSNVTSSEILTGITGTPPAVGETGVLEFTVYSESPLAFTAHWLTLAS